MIARQFMSFELRAQFNVRVSWLSYYNKYINGFQ
jgi:hypothetical protein